MHVPCLPLCNLEPKWGFFSLSFSLYATSSLSYCRILTTFSLLLVQPFKRYVKIGRVAQINYGKEYGRLIVIVDVIDQNKVTPPPPPKFLPLFTFTHIHLHAFLELVLALLIILIILGSCQSHGGCCFVAFLSIIVIVNFYQ